MEQKLAYSIHLGSDRNRSKVAKEIAKSNNSSTTSFSNNAVQNAQQLSKVNKHNLRDYDHNKDQIYKLIESVPAFKVANVVVHYDETSPHMHLIGIPVKDGYKNGMKKQVAKSQIFTKTSLKEIQDKMRAYCIEKFNEVYEQNAILKKKQKGRNRDINVNQMDGYRELKREQEKNAKNLKKLIIKVMD